jgi:beta-galactosidase
MMQAGTDLQRFAYLCRLSLVLFFLRVLSSANAAEEVQAQRERVSFNAGWHFQKGDPVGFEEQLSYARLKEHLTRYASQALGQFTTSFEPETNSLGSEVPFVQSGFDDSGWRNVTLPHDWGIEGPFRQEYPGDTGKLPWWGVGWYRKTFEFPALNAGRRIYLDLDGAMSYAVVWCNGRLAGGWPYGYASWRVDLTSLIKPGATNVIAIRLNNPPNSSRWYPGGGLYRNVWLVKTAPVHVAHWGTQITTPEVSAKSATVKIETRIVNTSNVQAPIEVETRLFHIKGSVRSRKLAAVSDVSTVTVPAGMSESLSHEIIVDNPKLWNLDMPNLYVAVTLLRQAGRVLDEYETTFGIRKIEFDADRGFLLNGQRVPFQGVCNHHDLGALGAAFNLRAAERQLEIMKEMGVNALRTTHNPAAPELLDLCDRMGILVIGEAFDCWHWGKTENDYARLFKDWSEFDLRAMIRRDRNHPSVIMWSIGNEIVNVVHPENDAIAKRLMRIVHEEDKTRAATAGINNTPVGYNGHQRNYDVFGFNYRSMEYGRFHKATPQIPVYGSETASTISSRGEYFFPVTEPKNGGRADFQMSSYDLYAPPWAWPPDAEFKWLDQAPATLGEFVWTGFDYLGEPTPYGDDFSSLLNIPDPAQRAQLRRELEAMGKLNSPSRSSYFGIVDLAGFKKDRFFLYQARWRPDLPMAHILPHWTWPGREGQVTPIHVYTSGDEAELFLNGKSLGRKQRQPVEYRFRWNDVKYEPGEVRVVAYKGGKKWATDVAKTAGLPSHLNLEADRSRIDADGLDLSFITARITDAKGELVPRANNLVRFEIDGPGEIIAVDNGDATSHESFQARERRTYNGMALVVVRSKISAQGRITVRAISHGLKPALIRLKMED